MASTRKEFHLNDRATFWIRRYEPFLALEILGDLQTKFLGPLVMFLEGNDASNDDETRMKSVVDGIEKLSKTLNGKELVTLSKTLLNGEYISISLDNEPPEKLTENLLNRAIDDVGEMVELIIEVIKENYAKVFTQGLARIGKGTSNTVN
jgi:hypothetical protein